jgi:DMSO/TMAO reductase YedYZ molybdopterin-dependent catalytic subunit
MKNRSIIIGGLLGGLSALIVAALNSLVSLLAGLPNIPFSIFDWMARHLPGGLVTFFIENMVATITRLKLGQTSTIAKQVEQASAVLMFIGLGVVFGVVLTILGYRRPEQLGNYGRIGGIILLILVFVMLLSFGTPPLGTLVTAIWLAVVFVGWGWVLSKMIEYTTIPATPGTTDASRRQFLTLVGIGSFTILVSAAGASLVSGRKSIPATGEPNSAAPGPEAIANSSTTSGPAQSPAESVLAARFPPVPGTRPELTPTAKFYRVDINTIIPQVDEASWRLEVVGLVNHPQKMTLEEIRSRPSVSQAITLECISNQVGGDLTSTGLWTGVRLKDILAEAGLKPEVQEISIQSVDGFYESVPMPEAMDERTLLVYAMNGQPLAPEHGYPLRIFIPDHYGMKQPKWITRLEAIDHPGAGFWVDRGWSKKAIPQITSVVDTIATDAYDPKTGLLPIGGIAYAGARGISKVEVQVDSGPWEPAELRTPPLSPLTWVEWRYPWKTQIGQHTFSVRAYDGSGQLQKAESTDPTPDGATGIHSKNALIAEEKGN